MIANLAQKSWYKSKLSWIGILGAIASAIPLVIDFLNAGVFNTQAFTSLIFSIATVVIRQWPGNQDTQDKPISPTKSILQ